LSGSEAPIFGSVSAADIANEIKASISHNPEASTIQIDESNIAIEGPDASRIKALGSYKVSVTLKDGSTIEKTVVVKPFTGQAIDITSQIPQEGERTITM